MPANSPFSSFSPSPLSPPQAVLDLRVRAASSTLTSFSPSTLSQPDTVVDLRICPSPISDGSTKACGADQTESDHEEEQPSDFGGDFGSNYAEQESNTDADESPSYGSATAEPPTLRERRVRQRFGPEEDYLLVVQVNGDAPYTAKQGEVNTQWQPVADKLNGSPNFLMRPIKGATAKARFKTLLAKYRSWEAKSATKSGTDESETPFIRAMTELMSNVDDYEAQREKDAAAKLGEQRAKVHSGEVVQQAAIARIHLGKRNSPSDGAADKDGDGQLSPVNLRPSKFAKGADE
ncbi:hypothetical protein PC121_g10288 [Phytophthora cactorum]|nr:hypothetical protein PC120_g4546 [Phytophthora cactorum]KAG3068161.1 hypothetical protein PC121_g10288 [Phytophthora cactorum]